jgi:phage gpG-like protein
MAKTNWVDVDFYGLDEQIHRLRQVRTQLETEMDRVMLRAALILEAEVKRMITNMKLVDTGALRASVHSFVRNRLTSTEGVVATNMEYAPFLEYGTGQKGQAGNHPDVPADYHYGDSPGIRSYKYMWTAWENKKDEIENYIDVEFRRLVGNA